MPESTSFFSAVRLLDGFSFFGNYTAGNATDFDSNLVPAEDVSVDAVLTSLYFNSIIFVFLMAFYECLRRVLPAVYSSRKRLHHVRPNRSRNHAEKSGHIREVSPDDSSSDSIDQENGDDSLRQKNSASLSSLPDDKPLDWIAPVFGVPWSKVRKLAGLDGYFFLRYIRMCVRITAVSSFWFFLILVPIYQSGSTSEHSAQGWYHISAANLPRDGWRMWVPCIFAYLFSAFIAFVIKQEYRHFLELRQDFLAKGTAHVNPQHHYSIMVENIPFELRSDRALMDYFHNLFPGKVHSASVVLNLPDLENASMRCTRTCRRLEKSIAYLHATCKRPVHVVGRGWLSLLGVDVPPLDCNCTDSYQDGIVTNDDLLGSRPRRGCRVDSISYYTQELAANSYILFKMQQRKAQIAESGNLSKRVDNWLDKAIRRATAVAKTIMDDSLVDNELRSPTDELGPSVVPQAESMTSYYGSFSPHTPDRRRGDHQTRRRISEVDKKAPLVEEYQLHEDSNSDYGVPFGSDQYSGALRRWAGRLGLDFVVAVTRFLNKQVDVTLEGVIGTTMSSTGFVTFSDLSSTTCAASAPLTAKASVIDVSVAPEPREIIWENAHVSQPTQQRREQVVNFILFLGMILWSFPLAAIQVFAKAEYLAQIPGMEWITTFHGGTFTSFVNGYLPVVALLGLICVLPVLFEYIAVGYERRKTFSDVQSSMLSRYFYFQLANIYISVTAGSLLKSLADILDHPSNILQLLGESLPTMVGYFVALLVTKIMAGLPMVFLRFGALSRMLFLRTLSNEKKLTQRELDAIYRLENVQYGWEFPTQLLVVVIVFTYAIICPIILPVGLVYFIGALTVYKKQVLYVYSPVYESGGAMFPIAVQRTLFGLICGQMTLLGYIVTRGCYYQPIFLVPLPLFTFWSMNYFQTTYAGPSNRLSLERAREYDRISFLDSSFREGTLDLSQESAQENVLKFDKNAYRQPVLTELATQPWFYRRGQTDAETLDVRGQLSHLSRTIRDADVPHPQWNPPTPC